MSEVLKEWPWETDPTKYAVLSRTREGFYRFQHTDQNAPPQFSFTPTQAVEAALAILEREGLRVVEGACLHGKDSQRYWIETEGEQPVQYNGERVLVILDPRKEASDEQPV